MNEKENLRSKNLFLINVAGVLSDFYFEIDEDVWFLANIRMLPRSISIAW